MANPSSPHTCPDYAAAPSGLTDMDGRAAEVGGRGPAYSNAGAIEEPPPDYFDIQVRMDCNLDRVGRNKRDPFD